MRILFAISILALLALLWASYSIASHVRRARKRRRPRTPAPPPPIPTPTPNPEFNPHTNTDRPTQ